MRLLPVRRLRAPGVFLTVALARSRRRLGGARSHRAGFSRRRRRQQILRGGRARAERGSARRRALLPPTRLFALDGQLWPRHRPVPRLGSLASPIRSSSSNTRSTSAPAFWCFSWRGGWAAPWRAGWPLPRCSFIRCRSPIRRAFLSETPATLLVTLSLLLLAMDRLIPAAAAIGLASMVRLDSFPALARVPHRRRAGVACGSTRAGAAGGGARRAGALARRLDGLQLGAHRRAAAGRRDLRQPRTSCHAQRAYLRWLRTWIVDESEYPLTFWRALSPWSMSETAYYPASAFDSLEERSEAAICSTALNRRDYFGPEVDEGFRRLAQARERRHPLRTFVALPLIRAYHLSTSPVHFLKGKLPRPTSCSTSCGCILRRDRGGRERARRRRPRRPGAARAAPPGGAAGRGLGGARFRVRRDRPGRRALSIGAVAVLEPAPGATALTFSTLTLPAPPPASPTRPCERAAAC